LEQFIMSSFIRVETPQSHAAVERAETLLGRLQAARRSFDGARGLAALLLAAIVSSMLVVADRLMSTNEQGGLLLAWVVLWGVAFAGLALFAGTARSVATGLLASLRSSARRRAEMQADARFMAHAELDPRVLSELSAIATRREAEAFAHA
jgi:hypothetical protein